MSILKELKQLESTIDTSYKNLNTKNKKIIYYLFISKVFIQKTIKEIQSTTNVISINDFKKLRK